MEPNNNMSAEEEEKENRKNKNLQKFLSEQSQHQQLLFFLKQNDNKRLRMGTVTSHSLTFAYGREGILDTAVELLDPELRPIPPQPNCQQSMQIYEDHRMLAADFLKVQTELSKMHSYKNELEEKLRLSEAQMAEAASKSDQEDVKKFVQLQKEKDALVQFRDKLATQLQLIKKAQKQQEVMGGALVGGAASQEPNATPAVDTLLPPTSNVDEGWVLVHGGNDKK